MSYVIKKRFRHLSSLLLCMKRAGYIKVKKEIIQKYSCLKPQPTAGLESVFTTMNN
ncbi:hypothetical protein MUB15_07870 [Priestia sp. OVS21]|nr:hypothetical protein [Priestia sp. OVS21]